MVGVREFTLIRFQGDTDISETYPKLLEAVKTGCQQVGGGASFVDGHLTKGRYDAIIQTEMPSSDNSVALWLQVHQAVGGGFITETLDGIPQEKLNQVLGQTRVARQTSSR